MTAAECSISAGLARTRQDAQFGEKRTPVCGNVEYFFTLAPQVMSS
jgi:hypothetical protein